MIGNDQLATALLKQGGAIEVEMDLEQDSKSKSGFRWTGPGPNLTFSAGTTTISRATVEERLPITFVLPFLRTWLLGEKDDVQPKL
jgi:HlyD family secretion protein